MPKPKPFGVGRIRVRVARGPRFDEDGCTRWRWRADRPVGKGRRAPVWSGWGTRDEAERAVLAVLGGRRPQRSDLRTVFDLMDMWLAAEMERPDLSPYSIRARKAHARAVARSSLQHVEVEHVRTGDLRRYVREAEAAGRAQSTIREDLRCFRQAWRWAQDEGVGVDRPPPALRLRVTETVYSRRTPTQAEVLRVLEVLRRPSRTPWVYRVVFLCWALGARRGEVAGLTWERVDLDAGTAELDGKTGARLVPLHPRVVAELQGWPREHETVHGTSARSVRSNLGARLRTACELAGVEVFSPHGLRRLAVDTLYRGEASPEVAAALLGHSVGTALRKYRQVGQAELRAVVEGTALGVVPAGEVVEFRAAAGATPVPNPVPNPDETTR